MSRQTATILLDAFAAALTVEDILAGRVLASGASEIRVVIEALRAATREALEAALVAPADAFERVELLRQAVAFEGVDSPLVTKAALALANARALGLPPVITPT